MIHQRVAGTGQPAFVACQAQNAVAGEILWGVGGGISQRLEQARSHQHRQVRFVHSQQGRRLPRRKPAGQMAQREEFPDGEGNHRYGLFIHVALPFPRQKEQLGDQSCQQRRRYTLPHPIGSPVLYIPTYYSVRLFLCPAARGPVSIHARTISKAFVGLPGHTERGLQLREWSYPGASEESPGCRLEVKCKSSPVIIGSEVSITTYDVLMASALAQPDAQSPTAAAQQCDFWRCTILRMELAWKCLQLDKGGLRSREL